MNEGEVLERVIGKRDDGPRRNERGERRERKYEELHSRIWDSTIDRSGYEAPPDQLIERREYD